jgi:hypothetical protein
MSLAVGCLRMERQSQVSSLNASRSNLARGSLDRMLIDRMQNNELLSSIRAIAMTFFRCLCDRDGVHPRGSIV